ncbi:DUF882 domain-containing protein [Nitratireductor sp. CAU 1489]|uniref:Murein endopeptidase K n=2 Tax=Nitratireductor arenosus TaxID=2682096 RepID=A0A844QA31_9HYPH|nr:DUF882 domain-containing protein [Nitratireductor arenosus]MVA95757.1 DUF882 domain-containing protein [Nitratireductor arenosus]
MAVLLLAACFMLTAADAHAETRTLKLYFIHTKERAEITYKRNGRYLSSGLNQINRFLRDWRRNEPTKMDPRLLDVVWEAYQDVRARDYIHVVSGYRSPSTNSMLRKRGRGVAKKSQHMLGRALDFYIPGVPLKKLRNAGLRAGVGGVGYYPRSGSPFVHFDTGSVRHWPRMSRGELASVFPNGKTLHVPTDGKPLPGYNQALASYKSRKKGGGTVQVARSDDRDAGASSSGTRSSGGGFLANLFGGGADEEEDNIAISQEPMRRGQTVTRTAPKPKPAAELPGVAVAAAPAQAPKAEEPPRVDTPETILAALPERRVPLPAFAPRPKADVGTALALAAADTAPETETAEETVLAYGVPLPATRPGAREAIALAAAGEKPAGDAAAAAEIRKSAIAGIIEKSRRLVADDERRDAEQREIVLAAFAPVPEFRPGEGPIKEIVAALPQPRPGDRLRAEITGATGPVPAKGGRLAAPKDTQRALLLASAGYRDAEAVIDTRVKTTGKGAKPGPSDAKGDRRAVTLPVEEIKARWALETAGRATRSIASAKTPSLAHNAIRIAPTQVYTSGFETAPAAPDPARFSGNAVTFLSVARFETE